MIGERDGAVVAGLPVTGASVAGEPVTYVGTVVGERVDVGHVVAGEIVGTTVAGEALGTTVAGEALGTTVTGDVVGTDGTMIFISNSFPVCVPPVLGTRDRIMRPSYGVPSQSLF